MDIKDSRIDAGKAFDWGKTSEFYAKYRDIYPDIFYQKVADRAVQHKHFLFAQHAQGFSAGFPLSVQPVRRFVHAALRLFIDIVRF